MTTQPHTQEDGPSLFDTLLSSVRDRKLDKNTATFSLRQAREYIVTAEDAFALGENWWTILHDERQFASSLALATKLDSNGDTWERRADVLVDYLGKHAHKPLVEMLEDAAQTGDFQCLHDAIMHTACLTANNDVVVPREEIAPFAALNLSRCRIFEDFDLCALEWLYIDTYRGVRECLRGMQELASDTEDWCWCAQTWCCIDRQSPQIKLCIQKAEAAARSWGDRRHICGMVCMEGFSSPQEKWQAIKDLESQAHTPEQWQDCADIWKEYIGDTPNAVRCLARVSSPSQ